MEERLQELGLTLPDAPPPAGNYLPSRRVGNVLYVAGTICLREGKMTHIGKVGETQTIETAQEAARVCTLNMLANIKQAAGSLDQVKQFVFINGFVNAQAGFTDSPKVINGASDLLVQIFGDAGKHARAAVGVTGLPLDSTVEIQGVVELKD